MYIIYLKYFFISGEEYIFQLWRKKYISTTIRKKYISTTVRKKYFNYRKNVYKCIQHKKIDRFINRNSFCIHLQNHLAFLRLALTKLHFWHERNVFDRERNVSKFGLSQIYCVNNAHGFSMINDKKLDHFVDKYKYIIIYETV